MAFHALVIEPDEAERRLLHECLAAEGWQVTEARSAEEAVQRLNEQRWSLIFYAEHGYAGIDEGGITFIGSLRKKLGATPYIVLMGSQGGPGPALEAIINGASDYIRKPCREIEVRKQASRILQRLRAARKETVNPPLAICPLTVELVTQDLELVGESEEIVGVVKKLGQILRGDYKPHGGADGKMKGRFRAPSFFITGETGTGKELVAHLIHRHSSYRGGPIVSINCSTLPPDLAESELFGHEPGAFTGAVKEKKGLWELADGGTLFLDEITEAPLSLMPKLLRVLQEGTLKRLGSNRWIQVNVQVVAASNRDLKTEIETGRFRSDLYHRLSLYKFHLPPLRERREDIPFLVAHFTRQHFAHPVKFSQDALDLLSQYSWPGNVRELENLVRAAVSLSTDGTVYAHDLVAYQELIGEKKGQCLRRSQPTLLERNTIDTGDESLEEKVRRFKLRLVKETLEKYRGNVTQAAFALGTTRQSLHRILKELDQ
jgi:DNA-binding NtrC family response regulator